MSETVKIEQLGHTDPMLREVNRGLMVAWINADLINRAEHDVRKSIVLYDADKMFVGAATRDQFDLPVLQSLMYTDGGVRFWSKGIV